MEATDTSSGVPAGRAGFWRRFAGSIIDALVVGVVTTILRYVLGGTTGGLIGLLISLGYYTYFHGSTGQTPGDAVMSIRVVDFRDGTGAPIGYGRAAIRWLVSIVSGLVLLLGYLWMLWDGEKQTWHDKAAGSVVVPTN